MICLQDIDTMGNELLLLEPEINNDRLHSTLLYHNNLH